MRLNSFEVTQDELTVENQNLKLYTDNILDKYVYSICSTDIEFEIEVL